jgi:hypothetical protein
MDESIIKYKAIDLADVYLLSDNDMPMIFVFDNTIFPQLQPSEQVRIMIRREHKPQHALFETPIKALQMEAV